ncbi:hypothetical protein HanIR_Chr02g0054551 [Helianthus annuus]|nr:hypothetical protein HanIR_Chr02g0054551 [Helianthus annuus]
MLSNSLYVCIYLTSLSSLFPQHTTWVFIPIHSRSGRRIRQIVRGTICPPQWPSKDPYILRRIAYPSKSISILRGLSFEPIEG